MNDEHMQDLSNQLIYLVNYISKQEELIKKMEQKLSIIDGIVNQLDAERFENDRDRAKR